MQGKMGVVVPSGALGEGWSKIVKIVFFFNGDGKKLKRICCFLPSFLFSPPSTPKRGRSAFGGKGIWGGLLAIWGWPWQLYRAIARKGRGPVQPGVGRQIYEKMPPIYGQLLDPLELSKRGDRRGRIWLQDSIN